MSCKLHFSLGSLEIGGTIGIHYLTSFKEMFVFLSLELQSAGKKDDCAYKQVQALGEGKTGFFYPRTKVLSEVTYFPDL
jgi:hypothetical protein